MSSYLRQDRLQIRGSFEPLPHPSSPIAILLHHLPRFLGDLVMTDGLHSTESQVVISTIGRRVVPKHG